MWIPITPKILFLVTSDMISYNQKKHVGEIYSVCLLYCVYGYVALQTFLLNLGLMPLRLVFSPDGRDHVPCCIREQVPDICQDLCRGEYTVVTDNVKTHFSCPTYIERTLSCIADGIGKSTNNTINFPNHPNKLLLLHKKMFWLHTKIIHMAHQRQHWLHATY